MNGEDRLRKIFDFDSPKKDEKGVAWSAFGGGEENCIQRFDIAT
jgi:hypothetical protein